MRRLSRVEDRAISGPIDTPAGRAPRRSPRSGIVPRVATALVLIPLALLAVWLGGAVYAATIAAMSIFLIFEWTRLVAGAEFGRGFYALSATAIIAVYFAAGGAYPTALAATLVGGVVATILEWGQRNPDSWAAVGAGYIVVPGIASIWLRDVPERGLWLTVLLFAVVWGADSGAYAFGKTIGGKKMVPRVSPGKTWSGTLGGVFTGGVVAAVIAPLAGIGGPVQWFVGGMLLSVASVAGDLAESQLKRAYGVKDSGSAFPGHGGVLDRLDGFLFAAPALAGLVLVVDRF